MATHPVEILLVEDNPHDLRLALHALERYHLANHIEVARDGAQALEFVFGTGTDEAHNFDAAPKLILLDLRLPKVDGLEVLQRIRADWRTQSIPVIVLTSSRADRDVVESYNLGVISYITKPVNFEQLAEAVSQLGFYWLILDEPMMNRQYS